MKKLILSLSIVGLALFNYAQSVVDNAVIPVAVNVNTIMRMNVVSGGNIEFAFNTLDQYQNGISNSARYNTTFTVASSVDFTVTLLTEDANLIGSDDATNTISLDLVGFSVQDVNTTGHTIAASCLFDATPVYDDLAATTGAGLAIISNGLAGDITANEFTIHWSCGDTSQGAANNMLDENADPDRYSTNMFLILEAL